jgi:hypothetical protein
MSAPHPITAGRASAPKHDCVARLNKQLAEHNTCLAFALSFSAPSRELIQVTTVKARDEVRKKPMALYASFCPFCGVKLEGGAT